jgi:hypothetical protein
MQIDIPWDILTKHVTDLAREVPLDKIMLEIEANCDGGGWSGCAGVQYVNIELETLHNSSNGVTPISLGRITWDDKHRVWPEVVAYA